MTTITITLSEEKWLKLKDIADQLGYTPEEVAAYEIDGSILRIPDLAAQIAKVKDTAAKLGLSVRELVGDDLEKWLTPLDEDFKQASAYVLTKNAELYRRLA